MAAPTSTSTATQRTAKLEPWVVETVFSGLVTGDVVKSAWSDFSRIVGKGRVPGWLVVAENVTGVDTSARQAGAEMLKDFRALGGTNVVAVIDALVIRMVASAISIASGTHVSFCATRDEGLQKLRASK